MSAPGFTAELAVGRPRRAYPSAREAAPGDRAGSVAPAYVDCEGTVCTCTGLLDCIDMMELSSLCLEGGEHDCTTDASGLTCGCVRH